MKKNTSLFIILLSLFLVSCGEFFYQNEQREFQKKYKFIPPKKLCSIGESPSQLEIAGPGQEITDILKELILNKKSFRRLSLVELNVAWALIQMNIRPDQVSPTSSLQILQVRRGNPQYFYFDSKNSETPYLAGLKYFLKKNGSKMSLRELASLLYQNLPPSFPITDEFADFLSRSSSKLENHDQFRLAYFKASQIIRKGESLPKLNFKKIVSYSKEISKKPRTHLFKYQLDSNTVISCNIDIGLYKKNIFLISNLSSPEGQPFGISKRNGDHIFMVASNFFSTPKPFKNTYLIEGDHLDNPMMICHLNNTKNLNRMTLLSTKGRDPGQHLYHILNFEIQDSESLVETQEYVNFPRHLFLRNPDRLIYESGKGSEEQLRNFLSLDFPIYHKGQLGRVWIHYFNQLSKNSSLIIDQRTEAGLSCIK